MMRFRESVILLKMTEGSNPGRIISVVGARRIILRGGCSYVCVRMHVVPKAPINDQSEGRRLEQEFIVL